MARLLSPVRWWRMLRTTHGFGVHSPFAFRFITEVIRQPHAYYAYEHMPDPLDRLAFRVALDCRPQEVTTTADVDTALRAIESGGSAILHGGSEAAIAAVRQAMTRGMTFVNNSGTLIAVTRDLPRQDFDLFF